MIWQNFKDDLYGHWNLIRWRSGYLCIWLVLLSLMLLAIAMAPIGRYPPFEPDAAFALSFFIFITLLLGWAIPNITLPPIRDNRHVTRYRYKCFIDLDRNGSTPINDIADFINKNKLFAGHFYAGSTPEARQRGKNFAEYRFVRLNDMMLVKMRF